MRAKKAPKTKFKQNEELHGVIKEEDSSHGEEIKEPEIKKRPLV